MTLIEPLSRPVRPRRTGVLTGYVLFHLNLMFSSIEEEQRPTVIARCYTPLLDLAEGGLKLGIEATGLTLEIIRDIDPAWIARLRRLIANGHIEFIGSGYAQAIGPLMPAAAVEKNLALGLATYEALLGIRPTIALINEQAWSGGLVPLYRAAGYSAVVMDWDDCAAHHPEWNRHWRYHPQRAIGADGSEIGLLWSNTIAFQKLQRLAHGDIDRDTYVDYIAAHRGPVDRVFALYTNDAECFDFRPSRFATEDKIVMGEWQVVADGLRALAERGINIVLPSEALATAATNTNANNPLVLEAPSNPVPVKKQPKYNLTRWSSSGRDDLWANTQCHRALRALGPTASDADWRTLLHLWSSDYRTHITEKRWAKFRAELEAFVSELSSRARSPEASETRDPGAANTGGGGPWVPALRSAAAGMTDIVHPTLSSDTRHILIETSALRLVLDKRRGLAVASMGRPNERPLIGGLAHGEIDDIALSADWYTGNCVFEGPGEPKITDLEWCDPISSTGPDGTITLTARIDTPLGPIEKILRIPTNAPRLDIETTFHWPSWGKGSLRLGHVTLKPDAFDMTQLAYRTHNGGRALERFPLFGTTVDLGAAVSFLISCRAGVGMTEGLLQLDDGINAIELTADLATSAVIGLVEHRTVHGQTFCRMMLSALEMDETRKPDTPSGLRTVRTSLALNRVNAC
ncbi:hypothetical protein sos41_12770 [Alphaproteobacteria bacterium SO-S41]|nr:hypothetical protein sos41_12770 [Alphaproteobacteria bacterium SO-S41]